jgi:nitroimidazol reductase NimA-like FMN-containing flavoprotein (pyridoxamine 5'-phosphate oxidase superfamily)
MDAAEVYLAKPPDEEIERQLSRPLGGVVGTLNPEGTIHLAFVIYLWENGKFYFETASMTKKVRNLRENPTVSFAVDADGFMVMVEGTARILEGDEATEINRKVRRQHLTPQAAETVGEAWGLVDDVAVEITPQKWRSWSSHKLGELAKSAAGDLPPDQWWVKE